MELSFYETDDLDDFVNSIVMIPEDDKLNGFYKIIKPSGKFFLVRKILCETRLLKINVKQNSKFETKVYEAIISNDFEKEEKYKKIRKTSINKKYPLVLCSVVQYEV